MAKCTTVVSVTNKASVVIICHKKNWQKFISNCISLYICLRVILTFYIIKNVKSRLFLSFIEIIFKSSLTNVQVYIIKCLYKFDGTYMHYHEAVDKNQFT